MVYYVVVGLEKNGEQIVGEGSLKEQSVLMHAIDLERKWAIKFLINSGKVSVDQTVIASCREFTQK